MTSSYTTNKKIEKPANGDFNNTWSTPVNNDWDIIDRAFGGQTLLNAVAVSGTVTLTATQYQAPIIVISGALTANINYQLPSGIGGYWFIFNNTSGSYSILFSSAGGGSTVTLAQGVTTAVICDGTNVGRADTNIPAAAGSPTQVQYNSGGQLAASSNFVFDGTGVSIGGIATPARKLDVAGAGRFLQDAAATSGAVVLRQNSGDTVGGFIQWVNNANTTEKGWMVVDTSSNMIFATGSVEAMRVTSAGRVGIGTSAPSTALQVNGTVTATAVAATTFATTNYSIVESGGYIYIKNGSTNICRIDSSGNAIFKGNVTAYGSI